MSVIEKERVDLTVDTEPEKKTEPPKKYQVVFHYGTTKICDCSVSILKDVFKMASGEALGYMLNARSKSKETVYVSARDEAETKADEANAAREWHRDNCGPLVMSTSFKCEPLP